MKTIIKKIVKGKKCIQLNGVNALLTKYSYSFSLYNTFDGWNSSVTVWQSFQMVFWTEVSSLFTWDFVGNEKKMLGTELLLLEHDPVSYKTSMYKWGEEETKSEKDTFDPGTLFNLQYYCWESKSSLTTKSLPHTSNSAFKGMIFVPSSSSVKSHFGQGN